MAQAMAGSFTEDTVRSLSQSFGEPSWLLDMRLKAFAEFGQLPEEKSPLYKKYAFISAFDISAFSLTSAKERVDLRSFFKDYLTGRETNIILQGNETEVYSELEDEVGSKGVKLLPLRDALREDEAIVKRAFESRLVKPEDDRYAAFVNAFFNSGTFVYVPRGVSVGSPLRKMLLTDDPKNAIVDQTLILAEDSSRLVFLEELYSAESGRPPFVASTLELRSGANASVDFSTIQLLDPRAVHVANKGVEVRDGGRVTTSALALGSEVTRSRVNYHLNGRGALAEGFEIFFTDAKQRFDFESNLVHNAPETTGSIQARGVLKGESRSIFKGMIRIRPPAKNARAYLAHHAMLLERTAKSDGIPGLEIDTNEVKATHSASVAQIDEEQLFYLMARGLSPDEAKKMVVLGFFEPVLSKVPVEQTREGARFMIEGKWDGVKRRLVDRETLLRITGEIVPEVKQSEDIFERHYKYR